MAYYKWSQKNIDAGLCPCGKNRRDGKSRCQECADSRAKWYQDHKEITIERARQAWLRQKDKVINYYGGVCVCCGENYPGFLQLDHIDGGGTKHREQIHAETGSRNLYAWVIRNGYPYGYQVLCANCNMAKGGNNNKCIHQLQREV